MNVGTVIALIKAFGVDPAVIESAVSDWLDDHPEATTTVEDGSITEEKLAAELLAKIDGKADADGYYNQMSVGNAEQLIAAVGVEDKVPYNFRTAGGAADIGDREVDKLVGGTIAWNQFADNVNSSGNHYVENWATTYKIDNGVITATNTRDFNQAGINFVTKDVTFQKDHVFLSTIDIISTDFTPTTISMNLTDHWSNLISSPSKSYTGAGRYSFVVKTCTSGTVGNLQRLLVRVNGDVTTGDKVVYKNAVLFDLTQMFGETIADYIYALETSTEGAGVAWFRKLFPKTYYAYNAGSLMSVKAKEHRLVGFNAWDEEWELGTIDQNGANATSDTTIRSKNYVPVIPNTSYYFNCLTENANTSVGGRYYDANKQYIGSSTINARASFTPPANAHYLRFVMLSWYGTTYKNDICLNLSWDGERDGEYEAYELHSYPLGNVELRGIPKLDSNNSLYYDGDTYESDGTVTRKYGIVDLGTLSWQYFSQFTRFAVSLPNAKVPDTNNDIAGLCCSAYKAVSSNVTLLETGELGIALSTSGNLQVRDTRYSDAATFKTAMSGVYLVYELATPTTESSDPFQNPQIVNDFGTEEYVDRDVDATTRDVAIPVGHETIYQANLRAKLEMAPASPDGDGDYIVRQTNGVNEYVPLVKELPTLPSEDGSYLLKVTVSGSTKTLSWEVQS